MFFIEAVDKIYIPYITDHEYDNALFKLDEHISLHPQKFHLIKGVDGKRELVDEYNSYKKITPENINVEKNNIYYKLNIPSCITDIIQHEKNIRRKKIHTIGAYGHLKTVVKIVEDAINKNYNKIMILEPDFYFAKNMQESKVKFDELKNLIVESDIYYLGASQPEWPFNFGINKSGYYKASKTCGTFGVILDKRIFEEYLYLLKGEFYPSDLCLTVFQKYPDMYKTYVSYPNLMICDLCTSNTSIPRNQLKFANTFRWNLKDYDVKQIFKFKNLKSNNVVCKLVIRLNFDQTDGTVYFNGVDTGFPKSFTNKSNNIYENPFINTESTVDITIYNMFVNSVEILYL